MLHPILGSIVCNLNVLHLVLILELSEFTLDEKALLAFFNVTHNLGIDIEALREGDDLLSNLWTNVDLHAVTHVEHLVHLLPIGA